MRIVPRRACTHFVFTVLGFATLASGSASLAAEPEKAAESAAKKYTATAYLLVERHEPHILSRAAEKDDPAEFESYRATQMQLMKWRFVLMAALRDPKVRDLPGVIREDARHRTIAWLGKEIRVECPDPRTGLFTVSLTSSDPNEAAVLVNAVVRAYMEEVVNYERQMRRDRLSELQQISAGKENEVRTKRAQLKRELENIGASALPAQAAVRQRLAADKCLLLQKELFALKDEYQRARGDLKVQKAGGSDTKRVEAQIGSLGELVTAREKEYQRAYDEAVAEGLSSVVAEMAEKELRVTEEILHSVVVERERLRIELNAPTRVKVLGDRNAPAAVPECPD